MPQVEPSPPAATARRFRWRQLCQGLAIGGIVGLVLFSLLAVMTWPALFVSESRELTGIDFKLQQTASYNVPSREGYSAWVYRLPDSTADALDTDQQSLRSYPMWCALAFDGYNRVRWQTLGELRAGSDQVLDSEVFAFAEANPDAMRDESFNEAFELSTKKSRQDEVLISGWYRKRNDSVVDYFLYILDLKNRLMIKLALTT